MPGRPDITITLEGDKQLVHTLRLASREITDFSDANSEAADKILHAANPLTPVLTGYLQESNTADSSEVEASVTNPLDYAPVIHNGWPAHHIAATPFLDAGLAYVSDQLPALYMDRVDEVLSEVEGA